MLYPKKVYIDKGIQIGPEEHFLNNPSDRGYVVEPGYKAIKLDYRARGRLILPDGSEVSSSISVHNAGVYYTEVFSLPVPAGNFFYHKDDDINETSILLFNSGLPDNLRFDIYYETRGSKIKASIVNVYNYGKNTFDSNGEIKLKHTYPFNISGIVVIASVEDGSSVSYSINVSEKSVTLTGSPGKVCSYLLIAIPS